LPQDQEEEKLEFRLPPNNFRRLTVNPTKEDLNDLKPFLRPIVKKGYFMSEDHYLDVNFRLLKEDFCRDLKEGILEYRRYNNRALKSLLNCYD